MYLSHSDVTSDEVRVSTTHPANLREIVESAAREHGFNLVATGQYESKKHSKPSHLRIASVHGLEEGDLLDERHATFYTAEVKYRTNLTEKEKELAKQPYHHNPSDIEEVAEVTLPSFESLIEMLHENAEAVSTPLPDAASRRKTVQTLQKEIVNTQILSWQLTKGEIYTNPHEEEHEYDQLYPNIRENPDWADSIFHHEESAESQSEGASVGLTDAWQNLLDVPYLFYENAMFHGYYKDKYNFKDIFWQQTELYDAADVTQCKDCSRIRLPVNLDENGSCEERDCEPYTF